MAKCSFKDCNIEENYLLYHIDDGKEKIVLCPNHSIIFAINEAGEEIEKYPSELPEGTELHCELCGKAGYEFREDRYTLKLCKEHIKKILKRNLSPEEFFVLYKKYPDMFLLHDDFYDPATGEAMQPVEI